MTPPAFEHVVTTCLQKEPELRFQTAHDVKLELQWVAAGSSSTGMAAMHAAAPKSRVGQRIGWAVGLVLALVLGVIAGAFVDRSVSSALMTKTVINPPDKTTLNLSGDAAGPPVLSPDGASLAFTANKADGNTAIWVRPMDSLEAQPLPGTENAVFPFWSPDGRSLGFFADGKLKAIDVNGSSPQVIANAPFGRGGAWGPTQASSS